MNEPRRILIFSLVYLPHYVGGAEIAVQEITNRISENEVSFDMITLKAPHEASFERIGKVNVHRIGFTSQLGHKVSKYLFPFLATFKAWRLHRRFNYHRAWAIMANYAGFAALFTHKLTGLPYLLTLQEGDPLQYILNRVRRVEKQFKNIFIRAEQVQAISHYLAQFARDMGHERDVKVVPNGVDVAYFSQMFPQSELEVLRASIGKEEGDVILVTASRLVEKNAVDDCIRSLKYLPPHVKLLILGVGPLEVSLRELVEKEHLNHRVIFQGYITHTDLPRYIRISDIFVRPSLSEGFGNSFIEAMAVGIPVIATEIGGIPDFLHDQKTGLFCEVHNPHDIARKVNELLNNIPLAKDIAGRARKMVGEQYDWNHVAAEMKKLF